MSTRSSRRLQAIAKDNDDDLAKPEPLNDGTNSNKNSKVKGEKKRSPVKKNTKKRQKKSTSNSDDQSVSSSASSSKKKARKVTKKNAKIVADDENSNKKSPAKKAKKKNAEVQCITERDELKKLWSDEDAKKSGSYTFKICSWNVAGLRALMKKNPNALADLVKKHDIDMLCLQETKLQESHLDDPKLRIRGHLLEVEGYDAYYSCSVAKKGYSGTAVFIKRRGIANKKKKGIEFFLIEKSKEEQALTEEMPIDPTLLVPEKVSYELGKEAHDAEGRAIIVEFPRFTVANLYVPNSGQKLERLNYRTEEYDKDLLAFMQKKQLERGLPVMWLGDLNVAHLNNDCYNFGAKHLDKQAGLTPQERQSFTDQLQAGFVDAFRHLHPEARGHYSYWSQRAGNREPNKGLRLDYFVCDPSFFNEESKVIARDSYMIPDQQGSDHGPVVLVLEFKP